MTEKVKYLFTNETVDGSLVFRSTINSFGLDHATDKNMYSFYTKFSERAMFDTGLLPVEGSGVLSIRKALNHTQVAYQHAPGKYYINWGSYEGDASAKKFLVAQPYRIVIIDFVNGNIYGARTFYSPVPITHPKTPLYHTNLPNINCRGYRGNGVGWICLYHTEDVSEYPFSEKLHKALERCSGVEAYNDQNMSETDGTRFYQEFAYAHRYLWDPVEWEKKTETEGVDWTLNEHLWLPVLVRNLDNQDKHYHDGEPLTFVNALFGNYQAYYTDELIPKPINAIARTDYELDTQKLFTEFKTAFIQAQPSNVPLIRTNAFSAGEHIKAQLAETKYIPSAEYAGDEDEDDEEDDDAYTTSYCHFCNQSEQHSKYDAPNDLVFIVDSGYYACDECLSSNFIYSESDGEYYHYTSEQGQKLVNKYLFNKVFCFHYNDDHINNELQNMSFSMPFMNEEQLQDRLHMFKLHFPSFFVHENLVIEFDAEIANPEHILQFCAKMSQFTGSPFDFLKSNSFHFVNDTDYFKVRFEALCSQCAHQMLSSVSNFELGIQKLRNIVENGIKNIQKFDQLDHSLQVNVLEMLSNNHICGFYSF